MATHGGKRIGAGKPKGYKASHTLTTQETRKNIIKMISERTEELMAAKLALALGHIKATTNESGDIKQIYTVSPDGNAIQYLLNQVIGKPTETIQVKDEARLLLVDF
jgi:ribosomal protein S4E